MMENPKVLLRVSNKEEVPVDEYTNNMYDKEIGEFKESDNFRFITTWEMAIAL